MCVKFNLLVVGITNKKEHYKNYFTYDYNKNSYKNKKNSKHIILKNIKIKNRHLKYKPL